MIEIPSTFPIYLYLLNYDYENSHPFIYIGFIIASV